MLRFDRGIRTRCDGALGALDPRVPCVPLCFPFLFLTIAPVDGGWRAARTACHAAAGTAVVTGTSTVTGTSGVTNVPRVTGTLVMTSTPCGWSTPDHNGYNRGTWSAGGLSIPEYGLYQPDRSDDKHRYAHTPADHQRNTVRDFIVPASSHPRELPVMAHATVTGGSDTFLINEKREGYYCHTMYYKGRALL